MPTFLNAQFNVGSNDVSFTSAQQTKLSAHFNDYSAIHLATKELHNHLKNQSAPASIALMVGDSIWQLQLEENEIRSSDMLIMRTTSSGDFIQQKGTCNTYKGIVNGDTNQITRLFINERIISGYFFSYGKQFEIAPAQEFLQEPFNPSLQETYIVFESKDRIGEPDFICLTNIDTSTLSGPFDDDLDWRTDCDAFNENWDNNPRYLELAVETDWEFYDRYGASGNTPEEKRELVINEIEMRILMIEGLYAQFNLHVILVFVHLWDVPTATDDPYTSNDLETNWDQVKNYWKNNMTFVQRDLVHFFTGKNLNGSGVVNDQGIASLCGSHDIVLATHDNGEFWSWSYSVSTERQGTGSPRWASAAHEIGHTMAVGHICECGIMDSGQDCIGAGPCPSGFDPLNFSNEAKKQICRYLNGLNGPYSRSNDVCLVEPPSVDFAFNLILESNQVIIGNIGEIVCSGETIMASFYNQFDPYTNISWTYSSNLTLVNEPANNIKEFQTGATGDAYISVTFDYQGQTVTYERQFHIGPPEFAGPWPYGITQITPTTWGIFFYEVPYASFYSYKVDGYNQLGQPIFSETGTTTDLSPFYTIPDDVCVKVIMRAGNDCGLSSQILQLTICPPNYYGVIPFSASEDADRATKRKDNSPKTKPIEKLVIYPNPASGWLTIQAPDLQLIETYELFDAKGQKIASGTDNKASVRIKTPDVSGIYWLRIQTTEGIFLQKVMLE